MSDIVITAAKRTAVGSFMGAFGTTPAHELGRQAVQAGERLAVIEAMKMENVLRATRDGTVKTLHAKAGDSLRVDQKIIEFA